jgi:hypothetical protein
VSATEPASESAAPVAVPAAEPSTGPLDPRDVPESVFVDRAGFPELVIHNTLTGPIAGLALTQALFPGQRVRAFSGLPIGLGLGVLLPIVLTGDEPVHASAAAFYNFGERWGLLTGPFVPALWSSDHHRDYWAATALFFGLGLGATLWLEPHLQLDPGQVSLLGTGHLFGMIIGGLLMLTFDVVPEGRAAFAAPVLLFGNAGLAFALLLREQFSIDRRRVLAVDLAGLVGMVGGAGVGFLITGGNDDWRQKPQVYGLSMLAGLGGGMALGYVLSASLDEYQGGIELLPPGPLGLMQGERVVPGLALVQGRF